MHKYNLEDVVDGLGTVVSCNTLPFDEALDEVLPISGELISLRDYAYALIQERTDSPLFEFDSYVNEGSLYNPRGNKKIIWLRDSLVLKYALQTTEAHKNHHEFVLPRFNVEMYLKNLDKEGEDKYHILSNHAQIPTRDFAKNKDMRWAFKDKTEEIGELLYDSGITELQIMMHIGDEAYIEKQQGPFINQLRLRRLADKLVIDGQYRALGKHMMLRALSRERGEHVNEDNFASQQSRYRLY